jgi:hypothetical protein
LMSVSGQQVDSFSGYNQVRFSTETLPAGCYFVKIQGTHSTPIIPLMIQH